MDKFLDSISKIRENKISELSLKRKAMFENNEKLSRIHQ